MTTQPPNHDEILTAAREGNAGLLRAWVRRLDVFDGNLAHQALVEAAQHGQTDCAFALLDVCGREGARQHAVMAAVETGHLDCADAFGPHSFHVVQQVVRTAAYQGARAVLLRFLPSLQNDPHGHDDCLAFSEGFFPEALTLAACQGHLDCLDLLIAHATDEERMAALQGAAQKGQADCVQWLIPLCPDSEGRNQALWLAAEHGQTDCVRLLIPVADPRAKENYALRCALAHHHANCVDLLAPASDAAAMWKHCLKRKDWQAMDLLVEHVDPAYWARAATLAPRDDMPRLWAKLDEQALRDVVADVSTPARPKVRL